MVVTHSEQGSCVTVLSVVMIVRRYIRTFDKKYRFNVPFKVLTKQVELY